MGKRSTQKKRGVGRGVAKHKIGSKPVKVKNNSETRTLFGIQHSVYFPHRKKLLRLSFLMLSQTSFSAIHTNS